MAQQTVSQRKPITLNVQKAQERELLVPEAEGAHFTGRTHDLGLVMQSDGGPSAIQLSGASGAVIKYTTSGGARKSL